MELTLQPALPVLPQPVRYTDKLLLIGSCFTEHMSVRLEQHKFTTLQNPHGILFNPLSVAHSMEQYLDNKRITGDDLFFLHETWNSWDHHSQFSGTDKAAVVQEINAGYATAHAFVQQADWVMITLGSAYQYYLKETNRPVVNNHRAPAQWFERKLLTVAEIVGAMKAMLDKLIAVNPGVKVLYTISPVRHIRDGVVENNRSKARLIEAVHTICETDDHCHYFGAYELVIDILRDYRFYDIDFVHPNYMATSYVWEEFVKHCIDRAAWPVMQQVKDIMTARHHRARFPDTANHRKFLNSYAAKAGRLMAEHPYLDLQEEQNYFNQG